MIKIIKYQRPTLFRNSALIDYDLVILAPTRKNSPFACIFPNVMQQQTSLIRPNLKTLQQAIQRLIPVQAVSVLR